MLVNVQEAQRGAAGTADSQPISFHSTSVTVVLFNVLIMLVTFFNHTSVGAIPGSK
jgi:hypothetical protein